MPIYFLSLIGKNINCCYYAASHAMRAKMQPFAAVVAWCVCLSVCLSVGRNFEPFESNRIDSRCCLGCRLWWAQVTDGGLDLLMRRDNFGGCPSLKCIRLYKQQMLQQPGVQCRLVHVGQSVTAIAQSACLTLQPCSTFFVSREVSGVVGQSGNTGCLTLLEVLEIYWNYFYPPLPPKSWKSTKSPANCLAVFDHLSLMCPTVFVCQRCSMFCVVSQR